jgi:uroporphyrinogen decarboxylase
MIVPGITSRERVFTALSHREPDRVPLIHGLTLHGARELGLSIKEYYSRPENVAEAQVRMREKYPHDAVTGFFYAAVEVEAWGGEVIFRDDGPPTSGEPFIAGVDRIDFLEVPHVMGTPCLLKGLQALRLLKERIKEEAAITGAVISPFSLPVMQMGFERYLDVLYEQPVAFERLMKVNEEFCVSWANAQLEAGADAIVFADPLASPDLVPQGLYMSSGFEIACRCISRIKGAVIYHMASARCLPIVEALSRTGAVCLGVSVHEDLAALKRECAGKIGVAGNLNGIEMRHWSQDRAEQAVKGAIAAAGPGGGYILTDNHGEIPWQVPFRVIAWISEAARKWGAYPLAWISPHA